MRDARLSKPKNPTAHTQNSLKQSVGRGAQGNVTSRFVKNHTVADLENFGYLDDEEDLSTLRTEYLSDSSRTIVASNDSPDIGFTYSANPYRGCEHGCIYCYARPTHEYLNLSAGLDFETKIFVKHEAPHLLREKILSKSWEGDTIFFSGVTDCYQPVERQLKLTRACMEVMLEYRNPVSVITKNALIRRDVDLYARMAEYQGVLVYLSITSLKPDLQKILEPRTSLPELRLRAIEELTKAGVPVGVNVAPVIPGLTDEELPAILKAAAEAGAISAGFTPVRLPLAVAPLFEEWLGVHFPDRKDKVLNAVRSIREGKLNDSTFGSRMRGEGARADAMADIFNLFAKKYGLQEKRVTLSSASFRKPAADEIRDLKSGQLRLF
ncbi:MAG: PA0069 family radical SAM protein [Bdellovibrionaceae bacterium]|nr:PA0069 family radical SAM protein [Pseudobdellovibrionaceae bacterium]